MRIRALEHRVQDLLGQREELEKHLEVVGSAMKRVGENVNTLCNLRRLAPATEAPRST